MNSLVLANMLANKAKLDLLEIQLSNERLEHKLELLNKPTLTESDSVLLKSLNKGYGLGGSQNEG